MAKALTDAQRKRALEIVRDLIGRPYGWTKGHSHRSKLVKGKRYEQYCLFGAADVARREIYPPGSRPSCFMFASELFGYSPIPFNDNPATKKRDVLAFVDNHLEKIERRRRS